MKAYYYKIIHTADDSIIDEGIIRSSEDIIYPSQNTGIDYLPSECEAHHFLDPTGTYILLGWKIELNRSDMRKFKV